MKDNLIKQRALLRSPLPTDFGEIGHMVGKASESLIKAAKLRKHHQQIALKEYNFLQQNLNRSDYTKK